MRKHTPDELAAAHKILKERAPHMKKMQADIEREKVEASQTIAMLQRRVRERTVDLELEGGDTITIYSRMSEKTLREIDEIEEERLEYIREAGELFELIKAKPKDITALKAEMTDLFNRAGDCWLKIISIITVDPAISFEWLKNNPDKYSSEDIADAYFAYKETRKQQILERAERVKRAIFFRPDSAGTGVQPDPTLAGNPGSP